MKKIPNYENYAVSKCGKIFNLNTGRQLREDIGNNGRARITVCKNNKPKRFQVHRLIAELFIPNPLDKETVNHKDGNPLNNHVDNLEWNTRQENQRHAVENELCPRGEENGNSCNKESTVKKVCELIQAGFQRSYILNETDISKSSFDDIRRRKTWAWLSHSYSW